MGGRCWSGLVLAVVLAALGWGGTNSGAQQPMRCAGELATIVADGDRIVSGTSGRDVIVGTRRGEVIRGRGGDDLICGRGGPDRIHGGAGEDVIRGNRGDDRIDGGAGDDVIRGNRGNDVLRGRLGNDLLDGGAGDDRTLGGRGVDRCIGGIGSDRRRGCETDPAVPAATPVPASPAVEVPDAAEPGNATDPIPTVDEIPMPPPSATPEPSPSATPEPSPQPTAQLPWTADGAVVSFTFDDGWISQATVAQPLLERFGYRGTFYLLSGYLGVFPYISEAEAIGLHAAGHEIGSHTISHPHLPQLPTDELRRELAASRSELEGVIGAPVAHFASPYGEADARVLDELRPVYSSHRGVFEGLNRRGLTDRYDIRVRNVLNTTSLATVEAWLDEAIATGGWLVLVYHDVIEAPRTYDTTPAALEAHLAAARARNLEGATVGQALAAFADN